MASKYKIVSIEEFQQIEGSICLGENIPRIDINGYKVESYLGSSSDYKHPTLDLYKIPQDAITQKYCSGFETLSNDWFTSEEI